MHMGFPSAVLEVGLCGLKQRRRVYAYPLGDSGLGQLGEAEEAPVGAPLGDVYIHQVDEVSRIWVEPLACDGIPPFLLFFVAAECWALVLQGAHGCFMTVCAVWVAAVVCSGYARRLCWLAGECPFRRRCLTPGYEHGVT